MISVQAVHDPEGRMAFECPNCGKALKLPFGPGGKVKCPRNSCGTRFRVLPANLIPASPPTPPPPIPLYVPATEKSAQMERGTRQPEPPPLEQYQAKSQAAASIANDGLFVCGSGSVPNVLLLTPSHLIFGSVQVAHLYQLRQQLRTGSFDSALMPNPSWSIPLKSLKWVETCAGDNRGRYVRIRSRDQTGQHEQLVVFDKHPEGASFLNQLRTQLGDNWHERLCRDWQQFRNDLGGFIFLSVFATGLFIIALGMASGKWDWETEERVSIRQLIFVAILWVISNLLGPIGVTLLWLATVGWAYYALIYSSWCDTLNLLKLSPRRS